MIEAITTFLAGIKLIIVDTVWPFLIGTIPGNIVLAIIGIAIISAFIYRLFNN